MRLSTTLKRGLDAALRHSPAQALALHRARRRLVVLAYHAVTNPSMFRSHLDYLVRNHHPVSLDDILMARGREFSLPSGAVLLTFDDGHRSVLDVAAPLLARLGIPALVFVVAGALDAERPLWWEEVDELITAQSGLGAYPQRSSAQVVRKLKLLPDHGRLEALQVLRGESQRTAHANTNLRADELPRLEQMGLEIGNHTMTHPILSRCPEGKIRAEIERAHDHLARLLGHPPRAFAYPNGDHDPYAEKALHRLGYRAAFLFDHCIADIERSHPLRISRVRVDAGTSIDRFALLTSGLHPAIHQALGRS